MSNLLLKDIDVSNFRSIRGRVRTPLDARVVLIHGENGAGKTSLLSAIELALTGRISSLKRVDPTYTKQLLHKSSTSGSVVVRVASDGEPGRSADDEDLATYRTELSKTGVQSTNTLDDRRAAFFSERAFLPQAMLSQLLQIYQEAEPSASSPLANFVSELLHLDRLDALEAGLKHFHDVRNVRKVGGMKFCNFASS